LQASALIAAATMAGVLSILVFHPSVLYTLPFAAGVTFYVVATDLIPEISRERRWAASAELGLGITLFYLTHLLLDAAGLK
jgi:zinc transporter ZupT